MGLTPFCVAALIVSIGRKQGTITKTKTKKRGAVNALVPYLSLLEKGTCGTVLGGKIICNIMSIVMHVGKEDIVPRTAKKLDIMDAKIGSGSIKCDLLICAWYSPLASPTSHGRGIVKRGKIT